MTSSETSSPMDTGGGSIDENSVEPCIWGSILLAVVLPLMADTLPRDANGICVIPHQHKMEKQEAPEDSHYFASSGRLAFRTNKVCDNCQARITDRFFYHCAENCDIDFCEDCHRKLQKVFESFFEESQEDADKRYDALVWVITITDHIASHVLHLNASDRNR